MRNQIFCFVDGRQKMFPSFVITNLMKNMIVLSIGVFESKERVFIAIGFPLSGHLLPLFAPSFIFQYIRQHIIKIYWTSISIVIHNLSYLFYYQTQSISQLTNSFHQYTYYYILNKEMSEPDNKASSCTVCVLFILNLLALSAAITITVLLYFWGFMGFMGTSSLSITNCTYPYHTLKFSDLTVQNKTIFGATTASAFAGILVFCIGLRLLVKNCSKDQKRSNEITKCNKMTLYLFICFMILGSTVQVGYYLTFLLEGSTCTFVAEGTQMLVLLILGSVALVFELIILLITVCCLKLQQDSEQKYKQVDTKQTEPNQIYPRRNEYKPSQSTQKRSQLRFRQQEVIKQDILESPSRKPFERIPQKNAVFVNKTYNSNPNDPEMRFVPRNKQENPVFNLHPRLATDGVDQILNAKYDRPGPKRDFQEDDQRYLIEARRNYMNEQNNRTPMLRAQQAAYQRYDGTVQKRRQRNNESQRRPPRREDRYRDDEDSFDDRDRNPNQYFRDYQPPRRRIESPLRMRNRQQLNYLGDRNY